MGVQPGVIIALSEKTAIGMVANMPSQVKSIAQNSNLQ
jgi:NAD(P)H-quinone oxidoreductase subunit 4